MMMQAILMNLYDKFSICMILTIYFFISHIPSYSQETSTREVQNTTEFEKFFHQSDEVDQKNLEDMHFDGSKKMQDFDSMDSIKKLAEKRNPDAQYALGVMYYEGKGVSQDYIEAFFWFEKSAEQGFRDAQFTLGVLYSAGEGVSQDYEKDLIRIKKAALNGIFEARA